jgi:hypothetical protein
MLAMALLSATPALAQHAGDIELQVVDGTIVTNERVYGAELGEIIPNEVDEPGFGSMPGTFPAGSSVRFSILDSLRKWDGTNFDTIPTETLSMGFGTSLGPISTPATPRIVAGFDLNVAADGSWHRHYDFVLNSPASTGVYLLQLQLESSDGGIAPTDPFFIVFNQNDSELNHEAAISFVESSLTVPEPSSVALVTIVSCAAVVRTRKRAASQHGATPTTPTTRRVGC